MQGPRLKPSAPKIASPAAAKPVALGRPKGGPSLMQQMKAKAMAPKAAAPRGAAPRVRAPKVSNPGRASYTPSFSAAKLTARAAASGPRPFGNTNRMQINSLISGLQGNYAALGGTLGPSKISYARPKVSAPRGPSVKSPGTPKAITVGRMKQPFVPYQPRPRSTSMKSPSPQRLAARAILNGPRRTTRPMAAIR